MCQENTMYCNYNTHAYKTVDVYDQCRFYF